MRFVVLLAAAFSYQPSIADAEFSSQSEVTDRSISMCGITATTPLEFQEKVEKSGLNRVDGGPRFVAYMSPMTDAGMVQWVFAKATEAAYPAATCSRIYPSPSHDWLQERRMRCDGSKGACDALIAEFKQLDADARAAIAAQVKR